MIVLFVFIVFYKLSFKVRFDIVKRRLSKHSEPLVAISLKRKCDSGGWDLLLTQCICHTNEKKLTKEDFNSVCLYSLKLLFPLRI